MSPRRSLLLRLEYNFPADGPINQSRGRQRQAFFGDDTGTLYSRQCALRGAGLAGHLPDGHRLLAGRGRWSRVLRHQGQYGEGGQGATGARLVAPTARRSRPRPPWPGASNLYVGTDNGTLYALDETTGSGAAGGQVVRRHPLLPGRRPGASTVVVGDRSGHVTAVTTATGPSGSALTGAAVTAAPMVNGGKVYVGSRTIRVRPQRRHRGHAVDVPDPGPDRLQYDPRSRRRSRSDPRMAPSTTSDSATGKVSIPSSPARPSWASPAHPVWSWPRSRTDRPSATASPDRRRHGRRRKRAALATSPVVDNGGILRHGARRQPVRVRHAGTGGLLDAPPTPSSGRPHRRRGVGGDHRRREFRGSGRGGHGHTGTGVGLESDQTCGRDPRRRITALTTSWASSASKWPVARSHGRARTPTAMERHGVIPAPARW